MTRKNRKLWKRSNEVYAQVRAVLFILLLNLVVFALCEIGNARTSQTVPVIETESEDIIRWKEPEPIVEAVTVPEVAAQETEVNEPKAVYFNVPLSEDLQEHIFAECEKHSISPAIIIAMIERESDYEADAVGDDGNSIGLMQINPKWHQKRMERLGCMDLFDPYQNVTVGIDLLAGYIKVNPDLYHVLMRYNGGKAYADEHLETGRYSEYAIEVVERADELENERGKQWQ